MRVRVRVRVRVGVRVRVYGRDATAGTDHRDGLLAWRMQSIRPIVATHSIMIQLIG